MRSCILIALCLLFVGGGNLSAFAQAAPASSPPPATGSLTGTVLDSASGKPVAYATVGLLPAAPPDKALTGVAADENGHFSLLKLVPGAYRVRLSFVGYRSRTQAVTVTDGATDLGTIRLGATSQQLAEVKVESQRPVVEVRPDRLIYNAEQDVTNAGGTAADVLRKAPLLSLDADGKPLMRGSGNLKILINNKPSALLAGSVAEALKQLPAEQIARVEVITTPSARYEAEGSTGIINIVLKKNDLEGINGRLSASGGNRGSGISGALNAHKGKVGVALSGSQHGYNGPNRMEMTRTDRTAATSQLTQSGEGRYHGQGVFSSLSLDYDPAPYHAFNLGANLSDYHGSSWQNTVNRYAMPDTTLLYSRGVDNTWTGTSYDVNASYTRTFEKQERREWVILTQYSYQNNRNSYDLKQYPGSEVGTTPATYGERSRGRAPGAELTLQTDYTHPFAFDTTNRTTLEIGAKAIRRHHDAITSLEVGNPPEAGYVFSAARSTALAYEQRIGAAYAIFGVGLSRKWSTRLGARLETAELSGQPSETPQFSSRFTNLLPNASLTFEPKQGQSATLTYSRRVQRPDIYLLNPFVNRADPRNIEYGNPELKPELNDALELSLSTIIKSATLTASLYARRTSRAIEAVYFRDPADASVVVQTVRNLANNDSYGLSMYASLKPLPKWDLSVGPDAAYRVLRSAALGVHNQGLQVSGNVNTSYQFPHGFTLQGFAYFGGRQVQLQGTGTGWTYYQLGLKKTLFKGKADLTANVANFLSPTRVFLNHTVTDQFDQQMRWYNYQRNVRVGFTYRFGSLKSQPRDHKRVENDDVKSGGGNGGGGQGQ